MKMLKYHDNMSGEELGSLAVELDSIAQMTEELSSNDYLNDHVYVAWILER